MKKLGLGSRMALSFIAAAVGIGIGISSGENETGEQIEILFPTEGTEIVAGSQVTFQRSYNVDPEIDFEGYTYRPGWDDIEIVTMNTSTGLTVPTTTGNYRFDVAAYSTDGTLLASTGVTYKVIEAVEPTGGVEILFPTEGSEIVAGSHTFIWSGSTNPASAFKQYSYVVIRSGSTTPLGYGTTTGSNRDFNINTTGDYTFGIAIIDTNNNTIATGSTKFKVIESTSPTTNPTGSITITSSSGQTISSGNNVTFTWTGSITPDSAFSGYGYALSGTDNNYFSGGTLSKTATSYTSPALSSGNYQFIISIIDTGSVSRAINTGYVTVTSGSNNTGGNTGITATGTVTITSSSGQTISSGNNVTINWTGSITPDSAFGGFYYDLSGTDNSYHTSGSLPKTATGYTSPALSSGNYVFTVSIISLPSQLSASPENEVIATDTGHVTVTYNTSGNGNGGENQGGGGDSTDPDELNMFIYSPSYSSGQSTIIEDNDVPFSFEGTYPSGHTFIKYQYYIKRNNRDGAVIYSGKYTTGGRQNFTHHLSDGKYYFEATLYTKNSSGVEADKNEGRGFLVFDDIYLDITYPSNNSHSCITQTGADFSWTGYAKNTFDSFEYAVRSDNGQYLYEGSTTGSNDTSFPLNDLIEGYYTFSVTMNYASGHSTGKSINFCVSLPEPESSLSITSPVQNKTYTGTSLKFEWNGSYDGGSFSYRYNLSGPTSTGNNNTTAKSFTGNNLRDGTYNFSVEMIDSNGDPIRSLSKKFYVELPYILKIDSPTSGYNSTSSNVSFSWTGTHPYKSGFCYTLSGLNNSTYNSKCTTDTATGLVLGDGRYSFTLNMMATYDNTNPLYSTGIIFNVNSNKSLSISSSPSGTITGTNVTGVNVTVYWTGDSENFSSYNYTLERNGSNYTGGTSTNITDSKTYEYLPSGTYDFHINMLNNTDGTITSGNTTFKIIISTLTFDTPVVSTNNVTLGWTGFAENFHHYEYSIDTTDGTKNIASGTWDQYYTGFTIKGLPNGNYRLIVNMKDSASSTITSDRVQFTIDYTVPTPTPSGGGGGGYSSKSHPTNNLSLSIGNDSPSANERIELIVNISDKYVGKVTFPKIQYYSGNIEKWVDIPVTSKNFVSDYSDDAKLGYVKFSSDDDGEKDLSQFLKFSKNGYYRIYAEDKDGYDAYVQIHVANKKAPTTNVSTNTGNIDSILREYIPEIFENKDTQEEIYIARSCKKYTIIYSETLNIYTSPNLKISEYFVNKEYLKRYLDSKNRYQQGCPTNVGWISTNYIDRSNDNTRYTAPNGKVYLITGEEGTYYSNELNRELKTPTSFKTIQELKYYIRDRNPLINMATLGPVN